MWPSALPVLLPPNRGRRHASHPGHNLPDRPVHHSGDRGAEDVEVSLLVNQPTSCLHDYTLTVSDMRAIEKADVLVMNGAGLEDFMGDAWRPLTRR